jgi:GDPmannose 4,6-dehydratase
VNEVGLSEHGSTLVKVSREFFRPLESDNYKADYSKAKKKLRWEPETKFKDLVRIMVESDKKRLEVNQP